MELADIQIAVTKGMNTTTFKGKNLEIVRIWASNHNGLLSPLNIKICNIQIQKPDPMLLPSKCCLPQFRTLPAFLLTNILA